MGTGDKLASMLIPIAILAAVGSLPGVFSGYNHTVAMGKSRMCDNTKTNTSLDWDEDDSVPYTCKSKVGLPIMPGSPCPFTPNELRKSEKKGILQELELEGYSHICMNKPIVYKSPYPASGPHRPAWPKYGEYKYVPPQRWLHNLEHGGIVALYHPCAPENIVKEFINTIVCAIEKESNKSKHKLPMFVITPNAYIPPCQPFVLLAWMKRLLMTEVLPSPMKKFVSKYYRKGPEKNVDNGQYVIGLKKISKDMKCGEQ